MRADRVDISWDTGKRKWVVRIEVGSEVIRRYCDDAHDADENKLLASAEQTVVDEGYQVERSKIVVSR